jgi:tetratricopeptide (TPR) repeat protein
MNAMSDDKRSVGCDPARLVGFIQGDLPQPEMDQVLAHLETCKACDRVFRDMVRLRAAAPEIRSGLSDRFYDFTPSGRPLRRWLWTYGAAAAVLAALVVGLFLIRSYLEQQADPMTGQLETGAFTYVSAVLRGPEMPKPDPAREAMMDTYTRADYAAFSEQASTWLRAHPEDAQVMFFAGVAAYLQGKYPVAEVYLNWNLATDKSRRPETLWYLANTWLREKKYADARPLLEELARLDHPYAPRAAELLRLLPRH